MASSPSVWGDRLVVHGMDGVVRVLDRINGRSLATFAVGSAIESSRSCERHRLFRPPGTGASTRSICVACALSGPFISGCKLTASVAVSGGTVYTGDYCGRLLALSKSSGRERWAAGVNGRIYGTPAVSAGRVFGPARPAARSRRSRRKGRFSGAVHDGRVCLFRARCLARARVLRVLQRHLYCTLGCSGRRSGRSVLVERFRRVVVVDGIAYAGSFAALESSALTRERPCRVALPARRIRACFRRRGRLLRHVYRGFRCSSEMRKWILGGAGLWCSCWSSPALRGICI